MKTQHTAINQWLERQGTTAEHLARAAGISPSSLYRFLNGDTDNIRLGTARAISRATGHELDVCDILGIPPRYVYVHVTASPPDSQSCEHQDWSYTMDALGRRINTPSGRIHTSEGVRKKNKQKKEKNPELQTNVLALLEHWALVFGKQAGRVKTSPKRERAVKRALVDWTLADLKRSIDGHGLNSWRHEEACRHEFATLLRPENIEAGLEAANPAEEQPSDDGFWDDIIAAEGD